MLIRTPADGIIHPVPGDITPRHAYEGRRDFIKLMAAGAAGPVLASWASREAFAQTARPGKLAPLQTMPTKVDGGMTVEKVTDYKDATSYNNFYEFGTDKGDPEQNTHTKKTSPW